MFVNAPPLFARANEAYESTKAAASDREPGQMQTLVAIVFSVAGAECFINEVTEIARQDTYFPHPPSAKEFAARFDEAGKDDAGKYVKLCCKFMLAKKSFTGKPYDRGDKIYQDFDLLVEVRNALVHSRPLETFEVNAQGVMIFEPAPLLNKLRSKNIIAQCKPGVHSPWISTIATRATARWACGAATAMEQSIIMAIQAIPDENESMFKVSIIDLYSRYFKLPD